jgi:hypothetical protein
MSGVIDATKKAAEFDVVQHNENPTFTMSMTVLLTADKSWAKVVFTPALGGLPRMPKKWMIVDPSKIKDKSGSPFVYGEESDPGYTNEVFEFATNVTRSSPGRFSGVSDLSDTSDDILPAGWLKALGGKATAIPFTAVVDGQGRLTSVAVKIPSAGKYKAATYQVTYDRYGATATPTAPAAADQTKAPASFYSLFED